MRLPERFQAYFPSYELAELDVEADHKLIITNILNLGDTEDIAWLFKRYPRERIIEVIQNPARGSWTKRALNYWGLMLDVEVDKGKAERALMDPTPRPDVYAPLFN